MKKTLILTGMCLATMAWAHEGVKNPAVLARMDAMKASGDALETIGGMARGRIDFDPVMATEAKVALLDAAIATPALFEPLETDPKSEALPLIWEGFARFRDLNDASIAAIQALDTQSAETLAQGLKPIGQACSACHERFRAER